MKTQKDEFIFLILTIFIGSMAGNYIDHENVFYLKDHWLPPVIGCISGLFVGLVVTLVNYMFDSDIK